MIRLTRAQFASLKLLIAGLIAAELFAIWVWATRPPRIYSDWLGLDDFARAPFSVSSIGLVGTTGPGHPPASWRCSTRANWSSPACSCWR